MSANTQSCCGTLVATDGCGSGVIGVAFKASVTETNGAGHSADMNSPLRSSFLQVHLLYRAVGQPTFDSTCWMELTSQSMGAVIGELGWKQGMRRLLNPNVRNVHCGFQRSLFPFQPLRP